MLFVSQQLEHSRHFVRRNLGQQREHFRCSVRPVAVVAGIAVVAAKKVAAIAVVAAKNVAAAGDPRRLHGLVKRGGLFRSSATASGATIRMVL